MKKDKPLLAFFGHHKCASRWINDIIRQVCYELGLNHVTVHNPSMFNNDLKGFICQGIDYLSYTNANYMYVKQIDNFCGFHVIRDPRDICVSAFFSHLKTHATENWPELIEHRKKLQNLPRHEGLLMDMKFMEGVFNDLESWDYTTENVMQVKMEDLVQNPYTTLLEIFDYLGILDYSRLNLRKILALSMSKHTRKFSKGFISLPNVKKLSYERILTIISDNDFRKKTKGRNPGMEDKNSHYRKGVVGDWRNHFEEEHIEYFKAHYNGMLLKLGYERNPDWS